MKIFTKFFVYFGVFLSYLFLLNSFASIFTLIYQAVAIDILSISGLPVAIFNIILFYAVVVGINKVGITDVVKNTKYSCK